MDPIIRAAAVSPVARQLRRPTPPPAPAAVPPPLAAPAVVPDPIAAAAREAAQAREAEREAEHARWNATAEEELRAARSAAQQRGYDQGYEQGEDEGRQLLQSQLERVKHLAVQLVLAKEQLLAEAEDTMVEIVFGVVCRMLGGAAAERGAVAALVREHAAAARGQVAILLHPDDLALLHDSAGAFDERVQLGADASVALGGCLVDRPAGLLDARLDTQLASLRDTLLAVRAARRSDVGPES